MCILKNPNIDVKDKEVHEHRFCECLNLPACSHHPDNYYFPAIGKFVYSGRDPFYHRNPFYACEDCHYGCEQVK